QQLLAADYADDGPAALSSISPNESPRPLHLSVHQEVHGWTLPGYDSFALLRFHITNHGSEVLRDLHVGLMADLDVVRRSDRLGHLNDVPYQANFFSTIHDDCEWRLEHPVTVLSDGASASQVTTGSGARERQNTSQTPNVALANDVLAIEKTGDRSLVSPGEQLTFRVVLNNFIYFPLLGVKVCVEDRIPEAFTYVRGSARLDGTAILDPAIEGRTLRFSFAGMP